MPKRKGGRVVHRKGKRKSGKMPPKVLEYFKLRNQGMSKAKAKAKAGL
jgi:hypothetical protein